MAVLPHNRPDSPSPAFSAPAIVAVICAVASFFFNAGLGLILAVVAILAGLAGVVMALSPRVRGGIASIVAIVAGLVGILAAILKLVF